MTIPAAPRGPRRRAGGPHRAGSGVPWNDPFPRLALCHLLSVSGETLVAVGLAGSLFFKVDPAAGREKVILGLLITMAPFALVGPFIGPFVDRVRGGPRAVILTTMGLRVAIAIGMTIAMANDSLALFLGAFAMLVLAKTYQIAKAAVVPLAVSGDVELVEANSKLQLLSGVAAIVAGGFGWVVLQIGPAWVGGCTVVVFAAASVAATRIITLGPASSAGGHRPSIGVPWHEVFDAGLGEIAREIVGGEIVGGETAGSAARPVRPSVLVGGYVMGVLRFVVGFSTFLLAFELRGEAERLSPVDFAVRRTVEIAAQNPFLRLRTQVDGAPPSWYFGVVLVVSVGGGLAGAAVAPRLRRLMSEDRMLVGACLSAGLAALIGFLARGLLAYVGLAFGVALAATLGKQAFDAIVQQDAAEANLGRAFSTYEARFQIVWVTGALVPSLIRIPIPFGSAVVAASAIVGAVVMLTGVRPRVAHTALGTSIGRSMIDRMPSPLRTRIDRALRAPTGPRPDPRPDERLDQRSGKSGI